MRKKYLVMGVLLVFISLVAVSYISKSLKKPEEAIQGATTQEENSKMLVDVNGDGVQEEVRLNYSDETVTSTTLLDPNGTQIAGTQEWLSFPRPISDSFMTYRLITSEKKEHYSLDFVAGPHQSERMFFEVYEGRVIPVCFTEKLTGPKDCLFFSANIEGGLIVDDLDSDGYMELIEIVDEYPTDGELTEEEDSAIEKVFGEEGIESSITDAKRIAKREKGGRGRSVVWAIYSYDGVIFTPQEGTEFERYFGILKDRNPEQIQKSDLGAESIDYNEFVRKVWSSVPESL